MQKLYAPTSNGTVTAQGLTYTISGGIVYVADAAVTGLLALGYVLPPDEAPEALDTLKELATALGNDPAFATTVSALLAAKQAKFATPTTVAASRDLADTDCGLVLKSTAVSGITLTIPNTLTAGFNCAVEQGGAGQVTIAAGSGVTLHNVDTQTKTSAQYAMVGVLNTGTNEYNLTGSTGA